jgi:hypothetical protein
MKFKHCIVALIVTVLFGSLLFSIPLYALDVSAPIVRLSILGGTHETGEPLSISAKVTDDQRVDRVILHYRQSHSTNNFSSLIMKQDFETGTYSASIPPADLSPPGVEYYIEAVDAMGNVSQDPFPSHPRVVMIDQKDQPAKHGKAKWVWAVVGAIAAGAALASNGGGSGGGDDVGVAGETSGSLTVTASSPE